MDGYSTTSTDVMSFEFARNNDDPMMNSSGWSLTRKLVCGLSVILLIMGGVFLYKNKNSVPIFGEEKPAPIATYETTVYFIPYLLTDDCYRTSSDEECISASIQVISRLTDFLKNNKRYKVTLTDVGKIKQMSKMKTQMDYNMDKIMSRDQLDIGGDSFEELDMLAVHYEDLLQSSLYGSIFLHNFLSKHQGGDSILMKQSGITNSKLKLLGDMGYESVAISSFDPAHVQQLNNEQSRIFKVDGRNLSVLVLNESTQAPMMSMLKSMVPLFEITHIGFNKDIRILVKFIDMIVGYQKYQRPSRIALPVGGDFAFRNMSGDYETMDKFWTLVQCNSWTGRLSGIMNVTYATPTQYFKDLFSEDSLWNSMLPEKATDFLPVTPRNSSANLASLRRYSSRPLEKMLVRTLGSVMRGMKNIISVFLLKHPQVYGFDLDLILEIVEDTTQRLAIWNNVGVSARVDCGVMISRLNSMKGYWNQSIVPFKSFLSSFLVAVNRFVNIETLSYSLLYPSFDTPPVIISGTYLLMFQAYTANIVLTFRSNSPVLMLSSSTGEEISKIGSIRLKDGKYYLHTFQFNSFSPYSISLLSATYDDSNSSISQPETSISRNGSLELLGRDVATLPDSSTLRIFDEAANSWLSIRFGAISLDAGENTTLKILTISSNIVMRDQRSGFTSIRIDFLETQRCYMILEYRAKRVSAVSKYTVHTHCIPTTRNNTTIEYPPSIKPFVSFAVQYITDVQEGEAFVVSDGLAKLTPLEYQMVYPLSNVAGVSTQSKTFTVTTDRHTSAMFSHLPTEIGNNLTITVHVYNEGMVNKSSTLCEEEKEVIQTHHFSYMTDPLSSAHRSLSQQMPLIFSLSSYVGDSIGLNSNLNSSVANFEDAETTKLANVKITFDVISKEKCYVTLHNMNEFIVVTFDLKKYLEQNLKIYYLKILQVDLTHDTVKSDESTDFSRIELLPCSLKRFAIFY